MTIVEQDILETNKQIKSKNDYVNYINPEFYCFIFIIEHFKEKRKSLEYFGT